MRLTCPKCRAVLDIIEITYGNKISYCSEHTGISLLNKCDYKLASKSKYEIIKKIQSDLKENKL